MLDNCALSNIVTPIWWMSLSFTAWLCLCLQGQLHKDMVWPVWCERTQVICTDHRSQPFGRNCFTHIESSLLLQPPYLTSTVLYWPIGHTFPQRHPEILWISFPEVWRPLQLHINAQVFGMGRPTSLDRHDGKESTQCWAYSAIPLGLVLDMSNSFSSEFVF